MSLGSRLRQARDKKGWSQTLAAEKLGIANSTLSGYERDYREPDAETIKQLASLYEVPINYLMDVEQKEEVPGWATYKDKRDFKKMLEEDEELMFDGVPLDDKDKQKIKDVLTGLFWEAKQMNKHKKKKD